jgi:hypothetical protein
LELTEDIITHLINGNLMNNRINIFNVDDLDIELDETKFVLFVPDLKKYLKLFKNISIFIY